jgi:hypothetical protein
VRCNERKDECIDSGRGYEKGDSEFEKWGA